MCANISTDGDVDQMNFYIDQISKKTNNIIEHMVKWVRRAQVILYNGIYKIYCCYLRKWNGLKSLLKQQNGNLVFQQFQSIRIIKQQS